MTTKTVIVLDTETTGFLPYDRIISLAAIKTIEASDESEILYRCFDPRKDSHPGAMEVHGWDNWTTRFQDLFADHAIELHEWLSASDILVMHNADFDLHFVNREFRKCGLPPLTAPAFCTLERARERWPGNAKLDACAQRIGFRRATNKHHPVEDAYFTWNLYRHFHGYPTLESPNQWPEPENFRPAQPRPAGVLPRRQVKKAGTAGLRWSSAQRKAVLTMARPVAILLVFLALADRHFAAQEKAVVLDLVRMTADRNGLPPSSLDVEVIVSELLDLELSSNLITRAMAAVIDDEHWRLRLPKLMSAMVMADGQFVQDERAALVLIKETLLRQQPFDSEQ